MTQKRKRYDKQFKIAAARRHRRQRETGARRHAQAGAAGEGGEQEAQTREGGRDGRPVREPRGQGVRRRSPQQAMGGRHHLHRDGRRTALPRSRDPRVPQEGRGLIDVRAHDREAGRGCARADGRKGEPARRLQPRLPRRPGFPVHFPGVPAPPRVPWDRPIHVAAGPTHGTTRSRNPSSRRSSASW